MYMYGGFLNTVSRLCTRDDTHHPLDDGTGEPDDDDTDTDIHEDAATLFDIVFVGAGSHDEESTIDTVRYRENSEEYHGIVDDILSRYISSILTDTNGSRLLAANHISRD